MSDLDSSARSLIDAARATPIEADRERVRSKLANRVGAGVFAASLTSATKIVAAAGATAVGTASVPPAAGAVGAAWWMTVIKIAGGVGLCGAVSFAGYTVLSKNHRTQPASNTPPAAVASVSEALPEARPEAPAPIDVEEAAPTASASPKTPTARLAVSGGPHPQRTLDEEADLVRQAHEALRAGNPGEALALANKHAALFPKGQLSEERAAIRVFAACALKRGNAETQARRFIAARPNSRLAERVKRACGL